MKQRKDLLSENYLNKKQIGRLLGITVTKARALYAMADEIDAQMPFRVEENKVRTSSVLKVAGLTFDEVKKRATLE